MKIKMAKYIRTKKDQIVIFPESFNHSDFAEFEPINAGFVDIKIDPDNHLFTCNCHGRSYSLGLKSKPEEDTELIKKQLFFNCK